MSEHPPLAVETAGLTHVFGRAGAARAPALASVDLAVPRASIYGLLGPNGAGKTTTLRLLLGLLRRQQGSIRVLGVDLARHRTAVLARTGSLIESPSLYGHLTAAENLAVWRVVHGAPAARVRELLALVDLADTGRKRVVHFSLGMRQRLGVAVALLAAPELLILDEPTNGLDPHGIIAMRELLQRLNRETGVTLLVSSHLLAEVERLATHVGVMARGRLVFQGPLSALVARAAATAHATVGTDDDARAAAALAAAGWRAHREPDHLRLPALDATELAAVNRTLVAAGVGVHHLGTRRRDLEAVFLELVRDHTPAPELS